LEGIEIVTNVSYIMDKTAHPYRYRMKTIQITIDDSLLQQVDQVTHLKKIARSQFIRTALQNALRQLAIDELEQKQIEGYRNLPENPGEFDAWESQQAWGCKWSGEK
jgi:Arc/MetJ family transcription regulator